MQILCIAILTLISGRVVDGKTGEPIDRARVSIGDVSVVTGSDGTFIIPANPHNIQIRLDTATGRISGTFNHPTTTALTEFHGTVLQNDDQYAAGFYKSAAGNGSFQIRRL